MPSNSSSGAPNPGMTREMVLARFIRLCSAVLSTPVPQEAAALMVNRIGELVRVDRAVLVRLSGGNPIAAVTGGGEVIQDSAFADAVLSVRSRYKDRPETVVVPGIAKDAETAFPHLAKIQRGMGGTRILWLPLWISSDNSHPPRYALWLERWRGRTWDGADIELAQHAALFLGHGMMKKQTGTGSKSRLKQWAAAAVLAVILCLPVSSVVTAPARIIPDSPHHVFAPMDGILKELFVRPGEWVEKNALLFRYDARVLDKRLEEAYRNVGVARAKLLRLEGAAHRDPEARAEVPVQQLEVERAEADAVFYAAQRALADVKAGQAGVIILDDPDALIGSAIQTGQAVMSVADPGVTKLAIQVPSQDVGLLKKGARAAVRLDSAPFKNLSALVTRIGFEVKLSDDMIPSVNAEAVWVGDPPDIQPGQKGSVKIYGPTTLLGLQILRKPVIHLRSFIGF